MLIIGTQAHFLSVDYQHSDLLELESPSQRIFQWICLYYEREWFGGTLHQLALFYA